MNYKKIVKNIIKEEIKKLYEVKVDKKAIANFLNKNYNVKQIRNYGQSDRQYDMMYRKIAKNFNLNYPKDYSIIDDIVHDILFGK